MKIGETAFWNEFQENDFINIGMSVDADMMRLQYMHVVGKDPVYVAMQSKGGGALDVKTHDVKTQGLAPTEGYLYQGYYMTGRSVGNRMAGMNAAAVGAPWWLANIAAGALHLLENRGPSKGSGPYRSTWKYMGEIEYTGRQYEAGYKSVKR